MYSDRIHRADVLPDVDFEVRYIHNIMKVDVIADNMELSINNDHGLKRHRESNLYSVFRITIVSTTQTRGEENETIYLDDHSHHMRMRMYDSICATQPEYHYRTYRKPQHRKSRNRVGKQPIYHDGVTHCRNLECQFRR